MTATNSNDTASWLDSRHSGDLIRLKRILRYRDSFQFIIAEHNDIVYRNKLAGYFSSLVDNPLTLEVDSEKYPDFFDLGYKLRELSPAPDLAQLMVADTWFKGEEGLKRFGAFNVFRENLAKCRFAILIWLPASLIKLFALRAPDMWSWRTAVLDFSLKKIPEPQLEMRDAYLDMGSAPYKQKLDRIEEVDSYLVKNKTVDQIVKAGLLLELGGIYHSLGKPEEALENLKQAEEIYDDLDYRRSKAIAMGYIARIKLSQGEVEEAMSLHQEQIKVFDNLGDARSKAVAMGDIARIKLSQGEVEEALRLHQEQIKIFDNLGDAREKAVAMGDIARIKLSQGEVEEAMSLHQERIKVFDNLGDARSKAIAMGDIARIKLSQGEVEEALRLHQEEIDVYDNLGDARSKAVAMGDIAHIKLSKGEVEEALRLHQEEIDVYDNLGDAGSKAVALWHMSQILFQKNETQKAREYLSESYRIALKVGIAEGIAFAGESLGALLCREGQKERGLEILKKSRRAFKKLDRTDEAARVKQTINNFRR